MVWFLIRKAVTYRQENLPAPAADESLAPRICISVLPTPPPFRALGRRPGGQTTGEGREPRQVRHAFGERAPSKEINRSE